jgi:hypothetical protein
MKVATPPEIELYAARYEDIASTPLRVTAHLAHGVPVIAYDPPSLDGLLSWAVVHEATGGRMLPELVGGAAYRLPVPLQPIAWVDGLPVWAATPLLADGESAEDSVVECKRTQTGRWTRGKGGKFSIDPASGRWRARMIPRPALIADRLASRCVGDGDEIARLLQKVTHIGKRRSSGGGLIERWTVETGQPWKWIENGRLTRSAPAELGPRLGLEIGDAPSLVAWTSPYWHRGLWRDGWPVGTEAREAVACTAPS